MKIVINDANILIDLVKLELVDAFSKLDFDLHTTDFVLGELNDEQKTPIVTLANEKKLTVIETTETVDLQGIAAILGESTGLSFEDWSVWYYSKKMLGILLTGDGKLRKLASKDNVEVRGMIYLFDVLLDQNLISFQEAIEKIKQLLPLNSRLPKNEIDKRIDLWNDGRCVG